MPLGVEDPVVRGVRGFLSDVVGREVEAARAEGQSMVAGNADPWAEMESSFWLRSPPTLERMPVRNSSKCCRESNRAGYLSTKTSIARILEY